MVGEYLRGKRQEAGLSIEELSKKTLIRKTYLEALEREDFQVINGDVFVRGYIKAYLKALNAEPDEAIKLYEQDILKSRPEPSVEPTPKQTTKFLYIVPASLAALALIIVLILLGGHKDTPTQTASVKTSSSPASRSLDVVIPLEEAEARFDNKELLEIKTLEETWIYLVIDDKLKYSMLLEPGENKRWTAEKGFFLKIGNAGGIEITYNGVNYGVPGSTGQVMRLHLPDDLQRLSQKAQITKNSQ